MCSDQDSCFDSVSILVSDAMNKKLNAPVTDGEIKVVVFCMSALKAPGPDRLNGMFY